MAVLLEVPFEAGAGSLLVEAERTDIPDGLVLAAPQPDEAAAKARRTLAESLERLEPVLRPVKDKRDVPGSGAVPPPGDRLDRRI